MGPYQSTFSPKHLQKYHKHFIHLLPQLPRDDGLQIRVRNGAEVSLIPCQYSFETRGPLPYGGEKLIYFNPWKSRGTLMISGNAKVPKGLVKTIIELYEGRETIRNQK